MTNYAAGFLSKCASAGVPEEAAFYMLKLADIQYQYAKPGFNIFGQPLAAPTPTKQQKADARAAGVSQPATVMPKPVSRRQTPASPLGEPDPVKPGNNTGLTSSPRKAGVTAPAKPASTVPTFVQQPAQDNSGNYDDFQLPDNLEVSSSNPAAPAKAPSIPSAKTYNTAKDTVRQGGNSWAAYGGRGGYDSNNPRMQQMAGAGTGPSAEQKAQQQAFKPTADQQNLQKAWSRMNPEQRMRNLRRAGVTEDQFNAMDDRTRYDTMARMRDAAPKKNQQQTARTVKTRQTPTRQGGTDSDMVPHPDNPSAMIDRASRDRIMQARAQNKRPTREQVADRLSAGRGAANAANYREQQARLAGQGGTPGNRMPRYSNGALAMIDLHGRPVSPTLRGSGRPIRRIGS